MADEELKKYSREEIKEHRSSESTWIVVDGKVYDVTEFLDEVCQCVCVVIASDLEVVLFSLVPCSTLEGRR